MGEGAGTAKSVFSMTATPPFQPLVNFSRAGFFFWVAALTYSWIAAEAYLILETESGPGQDFLRLNCMLPSFGPLTQHSSILVL